MRSWGFIPSHPDFASILLDEVSKAGCQSGKCTNNLHHLPQQDVVTLSISKTSLIYIHRQISALQCGEWRNLLLPKQKEADQFPNPWITHSSLVFVQILCTSWSTSVNWRRVLLIQNTLALFSLKYFCFLMLKKPHFGIIRGKYSENL